jgi:hypothetical protein
MSKHFALLLVAMVALLCSVGCSAVNDSHAAIEPDISLDQYNAVAIYDAESASFIEQNLAGLFRSIGFKVVGEKEAPSMPSGTVLGVRYTEATSIDLCSLTVLMEDFDTDRTVVTIRGRGQDFNLLLGIYTADCDMAWKQVQEKLRAVMPHLK